MSAGTLNLNIERGSIFAKTLVWKDADKNPISLAGKSARMQIRQRVDDIAYIAELTTGNSGIVLESGSVTGQIQLYIGAVETDTFDTDFAVYDLEIYENGNANNVIRLLQGQVIISEGVTR